MNKNSENKRSIQLRGDTFRSVTMIVRNVNLFEMGSGERELFATITDALDKYERDTSGSQGTLASVPPQAE